MIVFPCLGGSVDPLIVWWIYDDPGSSALVEIFDLSPEIHSFNFQSDETGHMSLSGARVN